MRSIVALIRHRNRAVRGFTCTLCNDTIETQDN